MAKKMGVRRYDRKVVAMAAEKLGDEANFHDLIERSYNAPDNCLGNLGDYAYERVPQHNRMYIEQAKVILEVAKGDGSAVFLGRSAAATTSPAWTPSRTMQAAAVTARNL